jgi:hypothetical protein
MATKEKKGGKGGKGDKKGEAVLEGPSFFGGGSGLRQLLSHICQLHSKPNVQSLPDAVDLAVAGCPG